MGNLQSSIGIRDRIFYEAEGSADGPCLIFVCAVHGNEPMPVHAAYDIVDRLKALSPEIKGKLIFALGNMSALARGERFIDVDLNRLWTVDSSKQILGDLAASTPSEYTEYRQLWDVLKKDVEQRERKTYLVDLHTFSSPGPAFLLPLISDPEAPDIANYLGIPMVHGVAASLGGHLIEYVHRFGHSAFGIEAGQHDDVRTIVRARAAIGLVLQKLGLLDQSTLSHLVSGEDIDYLRSTAADKAGTYSLCYNYLFEREGEFKMEPGFTSFDEVQEGQLLGRDSLGEVRAKQNGYILMPLYQKKGKSGFIIIEKT
jgi:succinylglutamate desuccinylase